MSTALAMMRKLAADRSALLGLILIGGLIVCALFAPWLATHPDDVWDLHPPERLLAPSAAHFFGTDRMGSDMYSRLLFGARITIVIAFVAVCPSAWWPATITTGSAIC